LEAPQNQGGSRRSLRRAGLPRRQGTASGSSRAGSAVAGAVDGTSRRHPADLSAGEHLALRGIGWLEPGAGTRARRPLPHGHARGCGSRSSRGRGALTCRPARPGKRRGERKGSPVGLELDSNGSFKAGSNRPRASWDPADTGPGGGLATP
jgi:hypothetical protein